MPDVLLFDRADRARILFTGANAVPTLNGLVTNDVAALVPGRGQYGAMLTSKGKIVADVRIFRRDDGVLIDASAQAGAGMRDMVKKFVNPRFATYQDVSETLDTLTLAGPGASALAATVAGLAVDLVTDLPPYGHADGMVDSQPITVVRTPELGVEAYDLIADRSLHTTLWDRLLQAGARVADTNAWEQYRIEAGWPAWGVDMTDATLPQEANFDELQGVSYTKGCYIGQEPVARIHFRGHVNRTLRRLAFEGAAIPVTGAALATAEGAEVGDVRSVTRLDDGRVLGIGMVRREVGDGATLAARWSAADGTAMESVVRVEGKAKGAIE